MKNLVMFLSGAILLFCIGVSFGTTNAKLDILLSKDLNDLEALKCVRPIKGDF